MNIDVNGLITTVGAVLTLVAAIVTLVPLFANRTRTITAPLDPSIKAIEIERKEIDQKLWNKRRVAIIISYSYVLVFFLSIVITSFALLSLFSLHPTHLTVAQQTNLTQYTITYTIVIIALNIVTIILSLTFLYLRPLFEVRFRFAKDIRFYIFQTVEIYVEGDIEYIFSKAHQALRGKNVQNIDVDFNARKLETSLKWSFKKAPAKVTLVSETINENTKCHSLTINYERANKLPKWLEKFSSSYFLHPTQLLDIDARSAFINQFIGKFLTKEVSSGDKDNKPN